MEPWRRVPSDTYVFTGLSTTGFPYYADADTGEMLIAEPGESYRIRAVEDYLPVPPGDGHWVAPAPPAPPAVPPAKPSPEGGE
jgi:hypothetical protein